MQRLGLAVSLWVLWATWPGIGGFVPSGAVLMVAAGTCPGGYTEVSALDGKTPLGTVAANGNIGTTGGADTITPAGSNAAISAGTPAGTNGASATNGNCAATAIAAGTGSLTACKTTAPNLAVTAQVFTGTALGTHTHTFTGTQFDNRSAFVRVIFCSKD